MENNYPPMYRTTPPPQLTLPSAQLIESLAMHDHLQQRTFITIPSSSSLRPTVKVSETSTSTSTTQSHPFNTSRALKTVSDNSTIDFAFLPSMPPPPPSREWIAVPFAPDNYAPMREAAEAEAPVMRPEISVISHGGTET